MKRWLCLIFAAIFVFSFTGCGKKAEKPLGEPLLWKVTDGAGHTLYLFGTMHVGDIRTDEAIRFAAETLKTCDALALEFDSEAYVQDTETMMADVRQFLYTDGSTVRDHIPDADLYQRMVQLSKDAELYNAMLEYYNLGFWTQELVSEAMLKKYSSLDSDHGAEAYLMKAAKETGLPVLSVESGSFQMALMNSFSDDLNLLMLRSTLDGAEHYGESLEELYTAWLNGDQTLIRSCLAEADVPDDAWSETEAALYADYNKKMEADRNVEMLKKAKEYLAGDKTVFFAVGEAHMLGKSGLVDALTEAGYSVELIHS